MLPGIALLLRSRSRTVLASAGAWLLTVGALGAACSNPQAELLTSGPDAGRGGEAAVSVQSVDSESVSTVGAGGVAGNGTLPAVTTSGTVGAGGAAVTGGGGAPPDADCVVHEDCALGSLCREGSCEPCGDSMTCACTEPFESEYVNDCLICQCPAVPD